MSAEPRQSECARHGIERIARRHLAKVMKNGHGNLTLSRETLQFRESLVVFPVTNVRALGSDSGKRVDYDKARRWSLRDPTIEVGDAAFVKTPPGGRKGEPAWPRLVPHQFAQPALEAPMLVLQRWLSSKAA